jgi:homopolymeric O-antigen transport system permease protein
MIRFPGSFFLGNLVQRRTLLFQLVRRDFDQRFVGSAVGWVWGVIHPLVLLLSWTFVFDVCLHMQVGENALTQHYPIWLFCGFLPWLLFQETVQRSATCLLDHANLIKKTVFPSEVAPLSIFLSSLVNHLIGLVLVVVTIAVWERKLSAMIVMLPLYMFLVGLFAVGVAWIVAALNVYLRDTAQVLSVVMTLWFWLTPIFISETKYPGRFRFLIALNPMAYLVRAYRERLLSSRPPDVKELAIVAAFGVVTFFLGGLFFRHLKRGFADVL